MCSNSLTLVYQMVSYVYKVVFQVLAVVFAFLNRSVVTKKELQNSKEMAIWITFNFFILIILAVADVALTFDPDLHDGIFSIGLLCSASSFLILVFFSTV